MAIVTRWSHVGCGICLLAILGAVAPAAAQPSPPSRPRSGPKQPAVPDPPLPGPDPDTRAKLDEQTTALADANRKLTEQQALLDGVSAALADAKREQAALGTAQQSLRDAIEAEHQARVDAETAAKANPAAPAVSSTWPTLTLSGLVQLDGTVRKSSQDELRQSGDLLNQDRFVLRRGRLRAAGNYSKVSGLAEIDLNTVSGSQVRVSTAEAAYQVGPWLGASIGILKIPFGFEVGQSDRERLFLERSTLERALFPGEYDVGAKLAGRWSFLRYAIAVQNGEPAGEKAFALRDPNQAKDITARAGVETQVANAHIAFGFSILQGRGFHAGTPATKDTLVWKDTNEDGLVGPSEVQVIQGLAATPSQSFDRFGLGGDAELSLDLEGFGMLMLYGELTVANNLDRAIALADPVATGRDFREIGYYAAVVYEPAAWSALGARFDRYDPDSDASEFRDGNVVPVDGSFSTLSFTGALRREHGRLILQYDHNTNHSGRTTSGVPTNLADDAVTLRAEVQL